MTKKSIFTSATKKIRATAARNISHARAEIAHEMKRIYWRDLYKRMHKITYQPDEIGIAGYRYMRILSHAVEKGTNRHMDRLADKIRNSLFEAIYEAGYTADIKNYKYRGPKWRFAFAADLTMRIHKKIAKTPNMQKVLKKVEPLRPHPYKPEYAEDKLPKGRYIKYLREIQYSYPGLIQDLSGLMGTIAYEYTQAIQLTYESELPGALIRFSKTRPISTHFIPKKRRINEIEAKGVSQRVEKDFDERLAKYLAERTARDE